MKMENVRERDGYWPAQMERGVTTGPMGRARSVALAGRTREKSFRRFQVLKTANEG